MFWRRKRKFADGIRAVTEVAGDQIAPGAGTWILVLAGLAAGAAATYAVAHGRKKKKAAKGG